MECEASYNFEGTDADELSFKKGQVLKAFNLSEDKNWCRAECDGREGLIPKNYVKFKPHSWYHGKITRVRAEQVLKNPSYPSGAFLLRDSENVPGDFSLSVRCGDTVQHYKILKDKSGQYFIWVVKFDSINKLIDYHRSQSISRTQNVLLMDIPQPGQPSVAPQMQAPVHNAMPPAQESFIVEANFDFKPQEAGELEFRKGDTITVTECRDRNWWSGISNGRAGIFPSNYVLVPPNIKARLGLS